MTQLSKLPIINLDTVEQLQTHLGKEGLGEVYTEFETETAQLLQDISTAIAQKDGELARRSFHTVKGSSATLGIERMHHWAMLGETNLRQKDLSKAADDLKNLEASFQEFRNVYRQILRL
jgi:HPt (histidine-containing phosphotransfer) domain-containing protein